MDEPITTPAAPDPASTTTPISNTAPSGWDHLDERVDTMAGDGIRDDEFREDAEARLAAEAEAALQEPVVEEPETPEVPETPEAPAAELDPAIAQRLQEADELATFLSKNPAEAALALLQTMTAHEKAKFLSSFGIGNQDAFNVEEYEPQGDMEAALKSRWNDLNAIPEVSRQVAAQAQQFGEYRGVIEPQVAYANVIAEVQAARIDAICEALGLDIPEPDMGAIEKALSKQGVKYRDAVRTTANYTKQVELAKQSRRPRPVTPGNTTNRQEPIAPGTSMVAIAKQLDPNFGR